MSSFPLFSAPRVLKGSGRALLGEERPVDSNGFALICALALVVLQQIAFLQKEMIDKIWTHKLTRNIVTCVLP